MRARLVLVLVLAIGQLPAFAAQSSSLAGTWAVEVRAVAIQSDNGTKWNLAASSGTLTLEQKGGAVTGTWQGRQPDAWTVTGRVDKHSFELQTEVRNIPVTKNGEKSTIARRWIFRGSADGDQLSGVFIMAGGEGQEPAQPFTAARKQK